MAPSFTAPAVVIFNACFTLASWVPAPQERPDASSTVHRTLALPMVRALWMYPDVPATNVRASDRPRAPAALGDRRARSPLLAAKNAALRLVVFPACRVLALGIGLATHGWVITVVRVAVALLGTLGVAAWLGIVFLDHPLPLGDRLRQRRRYLHMVVRRGTLLMSKYVVVLALGMLVIAPSWPSWNASTHGLMAHRETPRVILGVTMTCVVSIIGWVAVGVSLRSWCNAGTRACRNISPTRTRPLCKGPRKLG